MWLTAAGIAVLTAGAVVVLWWPATAGLNGAALVSARLDALKVGLSVAVGSGGVVALYLSWRRQRSTEADLDNRERALDHQKHDAAERRLSELYLKAVEQLGSPQAAVRHGGLYALERVALDNPHQRQTVINVICAYLRNPYVSPPKTSASRPLGVRRPLLRSATTRFAPTPSRSDGREALLQEREVRLTAQRILPLHFHPEADNFWRDIDIDLTGASLIDFSLTGCEVATAKFVGATFTGNAEFGQTTFDGDAEFDGATFTGGAEFDRANFTNDAGFDQATFDGDARFDRATFTNRAGFNGATFSSGANFDRATFGDARFDRANFSSRPRFNGAKFEGRAWFGWTTFSGGAGFHGSTFTGGAWFGGTTFDSDAGFGGTTFDSDAGFGGAAFKGDAGFDAATLKGIAGFEGTTFDGIAWFGGTTFDGIARFGGTTFEGIARFDAATFTGDAKFSGATFKGDSSFDAATFAGNAEFGSAIFNGNASFGGTTRKGVTFKPTEEDAAAPDEDVLDP